MYFAGEGTNFLALLALLLAVSPEIIPIMINAAPISAIVAIIMTSKSIKSKVYPHYTDFGPYVKRFLKRIIAESLQKNQRRQAVKMAAILII